MKLITAAVIYRNISSPFNHIPNKTPINPDTPPHGTKASPKGETPPAIFTEESTKPKTAKENSAIPFRTILSFSAIKFTLKKSFTLFITFSFPIKILYIKLYTISSENNVVIKDLNRKKNDKTDIHLDFMKDMC